MSIQMMPSQQELYDDLLNTQKSVNRRNHRIVLGYPQIGKTEVLIKLSKSLDCTYCNFAIEYLEEFLMNKRLENIQFYDFSSFIKTKFTLNNDKKIVVLDEVQEIISILTHNDIEKLRRFCEQFLSLDHSVDFILCMSICNMGFVKDLRERYSDRILQLSFSRNDKIFLKKNLLDNVELFDLDEISNIRQMLCQA